MQNMSEQIKSIVSENAQLKVSVSETKENTLKQLEVVWSAHSSNISNLNEIILGQMDKANRLSYDKSQLELEVTQMRTDLSAKSQNIANMSQTIHTQTTELQALAHTVADLQSQLTEQTQNYKLCQEHTA